MRRAVLLLLLAVCACTRPLTDNETSFADALIGDEIDTSRVAIAQNFGLAPPRRSAEFTYRPAQIGDEPCVRKPRPPGDASPPAAIALGNTLFLHGPIYSPDTLEGWPDRIRVPHALVLGHELVHVWQWQNRKRTGYTPFKAAGEGLRAFDPYISDIDPARPFLSYGYEQQAALVEDYLCFRIANPDHPRAAALRTILGPVFPLSQLDAALGSGGPS